MSIKQFLFVDDNGDYTEGYSDSQLIKRSCDASLAIGDLVFESNSISNGVDKVENNKNVRSVLGYVTEKPTSTTAMILTKGVITGLSGLTKTGKVYLSSSGGFTNTIPTGGYLQVLGHAIDSDQFDFNPINTKVKIYKPGFNFPLSYSDIYPSSTASYFGRYLDMDGNTLAVGSIDKFHVFIYDESSKTWTEEVTIDAPDGTGNHFGETIKISGDTIVVGSPNYGANGHTKNGRAYIYTRSGTTWTLKVTLDGPDEDNTYFSKVLEICNDVVIIGAPIEDAGGVSDAGTVKIYEFDGTNTTLKQTLAGSSGNDRLGNRDISIDGNKLLISEYGQRKVFLYEYNGTSWVLSETFTSSESYFGYSVDIKGDKIIIGSPYYNDGSITCGAYYVYTYDGTNWNNSAPIMASDKAANDHFGASVSVYDNYIISGAYGADPNSNNEAGKAYIFEFDGTNWAEKQIIEGTSANDSLGSYVYGYGGHIFIGAYGSELHGTDHGEVRDYKNS